MSDSYTGRSGRYSLDTGERVPLDPPPEPETSPIFSGFLPSSPATPPASEPTAPEENQP